MIASRTNFNNCITNVLFIFLFSYIHVFYYCSFLFNEDMLAVTINILRFDHPLWWIFPFGVQQKLQSLGLTLRLAEPKERYRSSSLRQLREEIAQTTIDTKRRNRNVSHRIEAIFFLFLVYYSHLEIDSFYLIVIPLLLLCYTVFFRLFWIMGCGNYGMPSLFHFIYSSYLITLYR